MVHSIGSIPGIIVMVIIICIMNHNRSIMAPIISTMMIIIIMAINANRHHGKCSKIGRIKSVIIRWNIGHIYR
jgi:hypothetical protein